QYDIAARSAKVLSSGKGEYKSFAFDKDENQLAFLAYKGDTKVQNKRYSIYFHKVSSGDTAKVLVDSLSSGIPAGWQLSEHGNLRFSNDGTRLFFGVAPTPRFKDTTLVDFEHAKVDIWHWQDDFLQTEQLVNLRRDLNKNYL